jgi:hypothetical protein
MRTTSHRHRRVGAFRRICGSAFGANHHLIPFRLDPADPDNDPGGADAMWTPGRTFIDAARNISVTVVSETASGFVVRIQNGVAPIGKLYLPTAMR